MNITKHHVLYPLLGILLLAVATFLFVEHEKRQHAEKDAAIQEQKVKDAETAKVAVEAVRQQQINDLEIERNKPATTNTIEKFLPAPLAPGSQVQIEPAKDGKPAQLVVTGDPLENLKRIQNMEIDCAENKVNADACTKTKTQDEGVIIPSLTKERDDLKKLAIPHWTATLGVTKARTGDYKPAAFIDYRVQKSWGITVGAANNSLFGGVSIHFGGGVK